MRFLPLSKDNKPLLPYKTHPEYGLTNGLELGEWAQEAIEAGFGVGVLLDNSGLVVVDCDSAIEFGRRSKTVFGYDNFLAICRQVGLPGIPKTWTVATRTDGHYHFYFKQHPDYPITRTSIHSQIPLVDIKVTGFVVSWHTAGYRVVRDSKLIQLPVELARHLHRPPSASQETVADGDRVMMQDHADYLVRTVQTAADGERNAVLYRVSRAYKMAGLTDIRSRGTLLQAAVYAGLTDKEADRTIESAWR